MFNFLKHKKEEPPQEQIIPSPELEKGDIVELKDQINLIIPDNKIFVKCPKCGRRGALSKSGRSIPRNIISTRMRVKYRCSNCQMISEHYFKFNDFMITSAFNLITGESYELVKHEEIFKDGTKNNN